MKKNNMKKEMLPLFEKFIQESLNGRRVQKNGKKLSKTSVVNYKNTLLYLRKLNESYTSPIVISCNFNKKHHEMVSEKKYWNVFYQRFKKVMYNDQCSDNYVGLSIKNLKTFFKYLETDKNFPHSDFYKKFYPPSNETQIFVLEQDKLKFLLFNSEFEDSLPEHLKVIKDIFVIGCTIGLRFSDLISLKPSNIQTIDESVYIVTCSKKTSTNTRIKIPYYIKDIVFKYLSSNNKFILPQMCLYTFNTRIKLLGEKAGWTYPVGKAKIIKGISKELKHKGMSYRYCDRLSSHIMRKTAVTTLLILGMPEPLVRKISGHSHNSKEFYKYNLVAKSA
jgi:integrase